MCDNVNINIQETNEIVNIVSSEIQEVIDINVFETTEDVTLNITEEIIQVNVNKVTNTGTNQSLAETLIYGNQTDGTNIILSDTDTILLENGSYLTKGTYDFGANGGISLVCGVGYENMWQGGIRHVFDNNGFIRHSTNCFNIIPDESFDVTLRFQTGSIWTLDDLTNYICIGADVGDAKWELYKEIPSSADFVPYTGATQDVNINTNDLYTKKVFLFDEVAENYGSIHYADGDFHVEDADGHKLLVIEDGFMQLHLSDTIQSNLFTTNLTETRNHYLPNNSGTIALTSDIPSVDAIPTDASNNPVSSNGVFDALATKENTITAGTTSQYYRGDKTFQTLNKSAVGLGNVDNTSDENKPVSTAQLTAINAKVTDAIVDGITTVAPSQNAVFDALATKQNSLGFTAENVANKSTSTSLGTSDTLYPTQNAVKVYADTKQSALGFTPENVANKSTNLVADIASDTKYPSTKAVGDYALAKAFSRYSFKANNTNTDNATAQDLYFQQSSKQSYTGTVTWSGVTAPSGTTNHSFNWIRIGNMVTLNITLVYGTAGTANTGTIVPLLSSMPTPINPDGLGASLRYVYPAYGKMSLNEASITTAASEVAMRVNTAADGYEFVITQASTGAKVLKITCQYFTA